MQFLEKLATRNHGTVFGALCFCLSLASFIVSTYGDGGLVGVSRGKSGDVEAYGYGAEVSFWLRSPSTISICCSVKLAMVVSMIGLLKVSLVWYSIALSSFKTC